MAYYFFLYNLSIASYISLLVYTKSSYSLVSSPFELISQQSVKVKLLETTFYTNYTAIILPNANDWYSTTQFLYTFLYLYRRTRRRRIWSLIFWQSISVYTYWYMKLPHEIQNEWYEYYIYVYLSTLTFKVS